jgi:hypothetical protein
MQFAVQSCSTSVRTMVGPSKVRASLRYGSWPAVSLPSNPCLTCEPSQNGFVFE